MKNYKTLSMGTAAFLLSLGTVLVAEEVVPGLQDVYASEIQQNVNESEIQPEGSEFINRTIFGYLAQGGYEGVAIGAYAGAAATTNAALYNTIVGYVAGGALTTGDGNSLFGTNAGDSITSGSQNVLMGLWAGQAITTGGDNTFIGYKSGKNINVSKSVMLGYQAGMSISRSNTLVIENSSSLSPLIYGEFDNNLVRINGNLEAKFNGSDTLNNHNLLAIDSNNTGSGASDVGFSMENKETDFTWAFRTYDPSEGFAATKVGTGGTEFEVGNIGTTLATTVVKMGGVTVFENGHLVTASSRSLKTDIQPLDTQAALDAFHKLQPVSYAYKAHKDEAVVGFIAEDVPELVAMPSRTSIDSTEIVAVLTSVLAETRAEMEAMRVKTEAMEAEIAELKGMK